MRNPVAFILVGSALCSTALAQDAFTYSFEGRAGLGYLHEETAEPSADGFRYIGPVARIELLGRAELQAAGSLRFGALTRISYQRGNQSNYDVTLRGDFLRESRVEFGGTNIDAAIYVGLPNVTLSYGNMETAFDLATREVERGASLLDGGNAVWMNLGDAAGSAGPRIGFPSEGPATGPDLQTVRVDLQVGELTFSASRSKGEAGIGREIQIDAAGAIWRHQVDEVTLFVGAGYDKGPMDRFNSLSFGFTSGGLNVVINRIHRTPLVFNSAEPDFDTSYEGLSLSYDFGDVTLGVAQSSQRSNIGSVFTGNGKAWFASWQVRDDFVIDFEFSDSDYRTGDDTRKASVAVAMKF